MERALRAILPESVAASLQVAKFVGRSSILKASSSSGEIADESRWNQGRGSEGVYGEIW